MKIDVGQVLKTLSGRPMEDDEKKPLTLKWACVNSLLAHYPKEEIDGTEKMKRFKMAYKIEKGGEVELSAEEVAKVKTLVSQSMTTLIVGQSHLMLERKVLDESGNEIEVE